MAINLKILLSIYNMFKKNRKSRKIRKQLLVDCLGGECKKCGYNKCLEAMDFHHINPEDKSFTIAKTRGSA